MSGRLQPPVSPAAEPFWEATRQQRLVLQWCVACERPIHFPREACPGCLGRDLEFRPASGTGTVYALTLGEGAPFPVALVDLDEGVRLMTNLVGDDASGASVGDRVAVAWEPLDDGRHLPVFVRR